MELIRNLLYIFITACVPVLTTYLCKFLYTKWTESKANIQNEQIRDTLDKVTNMVLDVVQSTNQTYVDELKKNGQFTKEAAEEAFNKSRDTAILMLSDDAIEIINDVYGNVDVYLDTLIESLVKQLKQ